MPHDIVRRLRRPATRRVRVHWPAELRFLRMRRACVVTDVSRLGARIEVEGMPPGVREVRLLLDIGPPIAAVLMWRRNDRIGLSFKREQEWLAEIGRCRFDSAEWVR
jgi:hypothetical protein